MPIVLSCTNGELYSVSVSCVPTTIYYALTKNKRRVVVRSSDRCLIAAIGHSNYGYQWSLVRSVLPGTSQRLVIDLALNWVSNSWLLSGDKTANCTSYDYYSKKCFDRLSQ